MTKEKVIDKVYNDFYGSIKQTYEEAKKLDPTIKYDDIKRYFEQNRVRRTNLKGYNSFIADHFKQEYQIDLFFINEDDDQKYFDLRDRLIDFYLKDNHISHDAEEAKHHPST